MPHPIIDYLELQVEHRMIFSLPRHLLFHVTKLARMKMAVYAMSTAIENVSVIPDIIGSLPSSYCDKSVLANNQYCVNEYSESSIATSPAPIPLVSTAFAVPEPYSILMRNACFASPHAG